MIAVRTTLCFKDVKLHVALFYRILIRFVMKIGIAVFHENLLVTSYVP